MLQFEFALLTATYQGAQADPAKRPYYTGAAYAQMPKPTPDKQSHAVITVEDEIGKQCMSLCFMNSTNQYSPCQPNVTLDINPDHSDQIPITPDIEMAKFLSWKGTERKMDKFMFLCQGPPRRVGDSAAESAATVVHRSDQKNDVVSNNSASVVGGKIINIITQTDEEHKVENGGCHNIHRCCNTWSTVGECVRNPWMQSSCQWACNICNSGEGNSTDKNCIDYHSKWPQWT